MSESRTLRAARYYLGRSWAVVPVAAGEKGPRLPGWQNLRLTEADLPTHFANGCNIGILNGAPSNNLTDGDLDHPAVLIAADYILPATGLISGRPGKPRSHRWYVCDPPVTTEQWRAPDGTMLAELRSTGTQTIVPPSYHPSGEEVVWVGTRPAIGEPEPMEGPLLRGYFARSAAAGLVAIHWPTTGARHDCALALAGALIRRSDWDDDTIAGFVLAVCAAAHDPETRNRLEGVDTTRARIAAGKPATGVPRLIEHLGQAVVDRLADWLGWAPPVVEVAVGTYRQTDYGNAERLVDAYGRDMRYHGGRRGLWSVWDGRYWAEDKTGDVERRAKETVRAIYGEIVGLSSDDAKKALFKHAIRSESDRSIKAMQSLARTELGLTVPPDAWDTDDYLLACENGTLDLRAGTLIEGHRREDLITRLVPAAYDPTATHPLWERFLEELGPPEIVAFLQRWFGYCLSGSTIEDILVFLYGPAGSGKTTIVEAIKAVLGGYARKTSFESFIARPNVGAPRNDIAGLAGARAVFAVEADRGRKLAHALVKELTGGDTFTARFLYGEDFEFRPRFKLTLVANDRPIIHDDDSGMWRRVRVVPFTVIPPEKRDPQIKETLRDPSIAGPAILRWLVMGYQMWKRDGLGAPPQIERETIAYRAAMDPLSDFIAECCELVSGASVGAGDLRRAYDGWANDNGVEKQDRPKTTAWGNRWREKGCRHEKVGGVAWWHGVRLLGKESTRTMDGVSS